MTPDSLAKLHARAFTMPRPWTAKEFADLLDSPLVFVTGDETSFAMGRVIADEVELLTLATDPDHRRQGLGKACLEAFETTARDRGARSAFLEVAANNTAAIALYSTQGYSRSGLRPGYYRSGTDQPVDAVIMIKALSPLVP